MSDADIALIGRNLAHALRRVAHDREDAAKKDVALLQHELCAAVREEEAAKENGDGQHSDGPQ